MSTTPQTSAPGLPVSSPFPRRKSRMGTVVWGDHQVTLGGSAPVRVQSMTNTDTADAVATAVQVKELALAGSELVRITVNNDDAAKAVPAKVAHNAHTVGFDELLDGKADIAKGVSRFDGLDPRHQRIMSDLDQAL